MDGVLIGKRIRVKNAANPNNIGIEGVAADEGRNAVVIIGNGGKEKLVPKAGTLFEVEGALVDGGKILSRPETRGKKERK